MTSLSCQADTILPARRSKRCPCYGNVSGWLAGWLAGWPSHAGIVSKRLNHLKTFSIIWKPFLQTSAPIHNSNGNPFSVLNTRGWEQLAIFMRFSTDIPDGYYGMLIGSHWCRMDGIIFDDLEWPLTRVSRSLYTYKSNISKMVRFTDKVTKEH